MSAALADEILESGLVDGPWYLRRYPDVLDAGLEPCAHFAAFGMREGRWPNRYFDPAWYAGQNPDVVAAGLDPFLHYMRHGDLEGRQPHPLVDPAWYRAAYDLPDPTPALQHFLANRADGIHAPGPELVAVTLLPEWRGEYAVDRYLAETDQIAPGLLPDPGIVRHSGLLDPNHYLLNAADVHQAGADPVLHYCHWGWRENRHPNPYFDPEWYIATNPDLAQRQMNPVVHYVLIGEPAGRRPVAWFDPAWYHTAHAVPEGMTALAHFLAHRREQTVSPNPLFDVAWYVARHRDEIGPNRDPFAHYLYAGTAQDIDPSPQFSAALYRRRFLGRPSRRFQRLLRPERQNPLVHHLLSTYR